MKFPFIRRARHETEVARLQDRLSEARQKAEHAKAAVQKLKGDLRQLRDQRAPELERMRELERLCESRATELEHYRAGMAYRSLRDRERHSTAGHESGAGGRSFPPLIAIWYHTCITFNREHGISIIKEQVEALQNSGLLDAADQFNVGLNGTESDLQCVRDLLPDKARVFLNEPETWSAGEVETMREMAAWSGAFPEHYVLYLHMKGLSFPPGKSGFEEMRDWRRRMEAAVIQRWQECVALLDSGNESIGQWWNVAFNGEYWAGNFFWVTSKFMATLPFIETEGHLHGGRYEAELWIGRGPRLPKIIAL